MYSCSEMLQGSGHVCLMVVAIMIQDYNQAAKYGVMASVTMLNVCAPWNLA